MNAPRPSLPSTATRQTRAQWFRALSEFLPAAYVRAYRARLNDLRALGTSPHCAWVYARAFMLAPDMAEITQK